MVSIADVITLPIFRHKTAYWNLVGAAIAPGQTADGNFPVSELSGGGRWLCKMNQIRITSKSEALQFRAARLKANFGVTPLLIYRNESLLLPTVSTTKPVPFSDSALFDDGSGFAIFAVLTSSAALRATSIAFSGEMFGTFGLAEGNSFTIVHPTQGARLYEIKFLISSAPNVYTAVIAPPLREAVTQGQALDFFRPRCIMRLQNPQDMDYTHQTYPFPDAQASFLELPF